jgi:hypothetical protein
MRSMAWFCPVLWLVACGGSTPPPVAPDTAPKDSTPSPSASASSAPAAASTPASTPSPAPASPSASASAAATYDDPDEAKDPATLTPLFEKGAKPVFPKATASEKDCWQTVSLVGDARKDYDALVGKCGSATGALEYVKPAIGRLHSVKDKRDTFLVKVHGGLCYRFFGVSDGTIKDLDILILRNNSLLGQDKVEGPVAIIDSDKAWCIDTDGDFEFRVEVDGQGDGRYAFGVWARPNKK